MYSFLLFLKKRKKETKKLTTSTAERDKKALLFDCYLSLLFLGIVRD
jgi:hypothetical protein